MLATKISFVDKATEIIAREAVAMDAALAFMAQDIEIIIKTGGRTPRKTSTMKNRTVHTKISVGHYRVTMPMEYTAVQELGQRSGAKPFAHYTTPGTGKGFFREAVDNTESKALGYFKSGSTLAGLQ